VRGHAVRVFRRTGRDGLSFLGAQPIPYVPIGEKIELNLGPDPEVIFQLVRLDFRRDHIWLREHGKSTYRRVDKPGVEVDHRSKVGGWDDHIVFAQRVRNYTGEPIELQVRRTFGGHVEFVSKLDAKNHDYQTVEYTATIPPSETTNLKYELVQHFGRNQKQNRLEVLARPEGAPSSANKTVRPRRDGPPQHRHTLTLLTFPLAAPQRPPPATTRPRLERRPRRQQVARHRRAITGLCPLEAKTAGG
jgi:hypothetical protein